MAKTLPSIEYNGVKYTRRFTPNSSGLADFVLRAKGVNRSWRTFSKDCDISPATFTRILNGGYKKPLSYKMLEKIVNNAAPGKMITMKEALYANGYFPEENSSPNKASAAKTDKTDYFSEDDSQDEVNCVFEIISKHLFSRKLAFSIFPEGTDDNSNTKSQMGFDEFEQSLSPWTFTLHIQNYKPYYIKYIHTIIREESILDDKDFMIMLKRFWVLFLKDSWEPQTTYDILYSFVFKTQRVYNMFIELMNKVKVNNFFSAVLLDTERRTVVDEYMCPRKEGDEAESVF